MTIRRGGPGSCTPISIRTCAATGPANAATSSAPNMNGFTVASNPQNPGSAGASATTPGREVPPRTLRVDPVAHEAGVAVALARHLRPAGEQPHGGEQQTIPQVRRVVRVLLERRVRDLLIVRIILELARRDRDRGLVGLAV